MTAPDQTLFSSLPHEVHLSFYAETVSTNDDLKVAARLGAPDYSLFIADRQTGGRGRTGHSFFSEKGLFMSILLPVKEELFDFVTPIAAVAVSRAIGDLTGENALVKWVNDVYINGKKVCGILTESVIAEGSRRVVLGIGVNLDLPESAFPAELRGTAASVSADRNALALRILHRLFELMDEGDLGAVRNAYRELCFLVGREIFVKKEGGRLKATALGLTDSLALSVRYEDGTREDLIAGEVSVIGASEL